MRLIILLTDGISFLALKSGEKQLKCPSSDFWHKGPKKNNWALAILKYLTYDINFNWPEAQKQKSAFGLPAKTSWHLVKVESGDLLNIVRVTKANKLWWFRYGNAKPKWEFKLIKLADCYKKCDADSSHCVNAFVAMNK